MAESGELNKIDWVGWEEYERMKYECDLCDYNKRTGDYRCKDCPYYLKFGYCDEPSKPYWEWYKISTVENHKKYAALFLTQLKEL